MLQIMTEKGLVRRDDSDRTHIYQPRLTEEQTQRQLVRDLVDRAFGGSASKLVMQALSARRATPEELGEIRKLIESSRDGGRPVMSAIEQPAAAAGGTGDRVGAAAFRLAGRARSAA